MRKELIFAVLFGLVVGLIITYGVYRARTSLQTTPVSLQEASPTPSPVVATNLIITAPDDESIQVETSATVAGTTDPNSFVVVITTDSQSLTQADISGNFSVELELNTGANVILMYAVNEDGQVITQERTVTVEPKPEPETAESAETETVKEDDAT